MLLNQSVKKNFNNRKYKCHHIILQWQLEYIFVRSYYGMSKYRQRTFGLLHRRKQVRIIGNITSLLGHIKA